LLFFQIYSLITENTDKKGYSFVAVLKSNSFCFMDVTGNRKGSFKIEKALALIEATSPDLEKQGFLAVVFVNREYSG
jgi:hypothetical protein